LRLVFAGTPAFAARALEALLQAGHEVALVLTQPDRPAGRGLKLASSAVAQCAARHAIPISQPATLKHNEVASQLARIAPEVMVVAAYGLLLPPEVLAVPRRGCLNIHASLLPRWRGAAPIQRAILAGDGETGVDLMQMEAGLDTGPVLLEKRTPIAADDTGGSLHDRLAELGARALSEGLAQVLRGDMPATLPQAADGVTYAHKLDKAEARLDWSEPAAALARKVRAFDPWPVAEAEIHGERMRIWSATPIAQATDATPGSLVATHRDAIDIATGDGVLRIHELQREGGRRVAVRDWLNARREAASR